MVGPAHLKAARGSAWARRKEGKKKTPAKGSERYLTPRRTEKSRKEKTFRCRSRPPEAGRGDAALVLKPGGGGGGGRKGRKKAQGHRNPTWKDPLKLCASLQGEQHEILKKGGKGPIRKKKKSNSPGREKICFVNRGGGVNPPPVTNTTPTPESEKKNVLSSARRGTSRRPPGTNLLPRRRNPFQSGTKESKEFNTISQVTRMKGKKLRYGALPSAEGRFTLIASSEKDIVREGDMGGTHRLREGDGFKDLTIIIDRGVLIKKKGPVLTVGEEGKKKRYMDFLHFWGEKVRKDCAWGLSVRT